MNPKPADIAPIAKMLAACKDNQLLCAIALFALWQMDLFTTVMNYGCGV